MRLDRWSDLPAAMRASTATRETVREKLNAEGCDAFIQAHPEFYQCPENAELLTAWLYLHNDAPFTRLNLELAVRALQDDLKTAPPPDTPVTDDKWTRDQFGTLSRSDALLEYQPGDDEKESLAKLADDPNLNDHQRKARLTKLRLLAGQQRREFSNLKPGADPAIRV